MKLTQKLLGLLHRVFSPDPDRFLALRLNCDGAGLTWEVADGILTTTVTGGTARNLRLDLSAYTLRELVNYIAAQPGYVIPRAGSSEQLALSARVLMDGTGDVATSNGDILYGYSSLVWAYMEAYAGELKAAKAQIPEAIKQMNLRDASDDWLDELGGFYGIRRGQGESDESYGPRVVAEVVRPRSNNVAIEKAISYYTGQQTKVTDVTLYGDPFPTYDGEITRNSAYRYQQQTPPIFGLFDVRLGYDLLGGDDMSAFAARCTAIVNQLRAAGTHMRALLLESGSMEDSFTAPTDPDGDLPLMMTPILVDTLTEPTESDVVLASVFGTFADSLDIPADDTTGTIVYSMKYNGIRTRNSAVNYCSGTTAAL